MRGDRKPSPAPTYPGISIAALPLLAVRRAVVGAGVNECQIAEEANLDILGDEAADRHRPRDLRKELRSVDQ